MKHIRGFLRVLFLLSLAFTACKPNKKEAKERTAFNLKESYLAKDEAEFLHQFPKEFDEYRIYFGWDFVEDKPQELYNDANSYVDYWFDLIEKYPKYVNKLIALCKHGSWEPDAVNYLQDKVLKYIKKQNKSHLINNLSDAEAQSVLFFLFNGPHPKPDTNFASLLSPSKKVILEELFETDFYDDNENPDPIFDENTTIVEPKLSDFEGTEHYFIKDIDINNDGVLDKVVSAETYQGDELYLFVNEGNNYKFVLKTTNFSQDGGNQIQDIRPTKTGFEIFTAFPDGGFLEALYYVSFKNSNWILTHTIYKTKSSNQEDAFVYMCNVKQGLNMSAYKSFKLNEMPDETNRDKTCQMEAIGKY